MKMKNINQKTKKELIEGNRCLLARALGLHATLRDLLENVDERIKHLDILIENQDLDESDAWEQFCGWWDTNKISFNEG